MERMGNWSNESTLDIVFLKNDPRNHTQNFQSVFSSSQSHHTNFVSEIVGADLKLQSPKVVNFAKNQRFGAIGDG